MAAGADAGAERMKGRLLLWVPLALFGLFFGVFAAGLIIPKDDVIASRMVGKPMPQFSLPPAVPQNPALSSRDLATGKPQLLNIFASWCLPCIAEAPHLMAMQRAGVTINAIAIRDTPQDVNRFLSRHGNPYTRIGRDDVSAVQLAIGSSGVPETFVIDGKGRIVHQHVGDIRAEDVPELMQILEDAR
jgi:cytochrome c biogenesis protein CcmG/thiol:disulfide interchange protein DsbE